MKLNTRFVPVLITLSLGVLVAVACMQMFVMHPGSDEVLRGTTSSAGAAAINFKRTVATWQAVFLTRDVRVAYAQFIDAGDAMPSEQSHVVAHIVGGILYDIDGLAGLSLCTDDFNYGCYHGFSSRVIEERGIDGIADLTDACKQLSTLDCEHGIGHGLMVYFGDEHVQEALGECSVFDHRTGGCTDGVFMEYFLSSMRLGENRGGLAFDDRTPDSVCAPFSDVYERQVCYYWLPVLWRSKVRTTESVPAQFVYVGGLCERVADARMRAACFSGAGTQTVLIAEYSAEKSRELCTAMPDDGQGACQKEAIEYIKRRTHTDL